MQSNMLNATGSVTHNKTELRLSLVIPCYNEEQNLQLLVDRCRQVVQDKPMQIVLVDNGSTDGSPRVLEELLAGQEAIKSVRVENNQGYGHGILFGLAHAEGDVLAWTHADMQTDPHDAIAGLKLFETADDPKTLFVKGLRYGRPLGDRFFTFGMSVFETMLMGTLLRDINAQPTMFHRALYETFKSPPSDFSLDLYAYAIAKREKARVERFPVKFGERAYGISHWNVDMASKVKFIKRTWQYSLSLRQKLSQS